ncbi:MAG: spermidine/putrescine ABC transporter substrate-binding protein [Clostridia bacterium]|nr:spermidine/putrescine ABC transporter substrate-binding protein [Clostridia bacterium]
MKKIVAMVILASVILTTAFAMTGCSDRVVLNVFNWGEYIDESLIDRFEDETGIKVNYKTYDTNETLLAKLEAGGVSYDVVFPSDYAISEMIKRDMLLPIDFGNIPNFIYIDGRFKNREYDPENKYSVPYFWGTIGILYNKNMVDDPVDSWSILWDEKYKGKILMKKDVRDAMGIALKLLGYSMNSTNDSELQEAKELLVSQKDLINGYYGDEIKDMIANGDAALGVTYSGDFMDLYWDESTDFSYIGYGVPREGTNLWFDAMVIPKVSKHKAEAEMFINFMLDPEIAFQNSNEVGYTSPNTEALRRIREESPEVFELPAYWPDDSIVELSEVYVDLGEYKTIYNQIWMEVRIE